jgi:hypothetical protein
VKALRYHEEDREEFLHEVRFYSAISKRLGERFDKAIQAAEARAADFRKWVRLSSMELAGSFQRSSSSHWSTWQPMLKSSSWLSRLFGGSRATGSRGSVTAKGKGWIALAAI